MQYYKKEDIELYYRLLGLEIPKKIDNVKLGCFFDYFYESEQYNSLEASLKNLSHLYCLLLDTIRIVLYKDEEEQDLAMKASIDIISKLSCFDVVDKEDPELNFLRTTNLISAIIDGLLAVGDINKFYLYFQNASNRSLFKKEKEQLKNSSELRKLYLLMIYSKYADIGRDHLMFDEFNDVSSSNLEDMILYNLNNGVPLAYNELSDEEITFFRPKLKELKNNKSN